MGQDKSELTRADVRNYLRQYQRAQRRKEELKKRLTDLQLAMRFPVKDKSGEAPAISYRLEEISQRISDQHAEAADAIINIMEVLDYLPADSPERDIIELRYIDGLGWGAIERRIYMSRSRASFHEMHGIDILLKYQRVRRLVTEYKQA